MPHSSRLVLGIDPGVTGAVALALSNDDGGVTLMDVQDIPTAKVKVNGSVKSHLLLTELAQLLRNLSESPFGLSADVFIEEVHAMPGQGVTSMFRFGHAAGAIEGVCAGLGMVIHKIAPKQWQSLARTRKDPDAGRLRAGQLFPSLAGKFARKLDHNRADAALIAYAGALTLRYP